MRGYVNLSFVFPMACLKIDQHLFELYLFSSNTVLKYIIFIFCFSLLYMHAVIFFTGLNVLFCWFLCFLKKSLVFCLEDISKPFVNQGSLSTSFGLFFPSHKGNDLSNVVKDTSIHFLYAVFGHYIWVI